jgi:tetratricopeptide (TPR) repeat protein
MMILNKHRILVVLLFTFLILRGYSQDSKDEKFNAGIEFYKAGNYQEALETWKELYNAGYHSADLNYNIGNAYFKLNNTPGAILFFERARLLKPADEDIQYNLQIARTLVVDKIEEIPQLFFVRWYNFISLLASTNTWAKTSLISFILCLVFLSLYFYSGKYRLKVLGFWMALLLLLISVFSITLSSRNRALIKENNMAIIFSSQISVKSSPDDSGTDLFVIHEGTKVAVEDEVGEWLEIKLSDGNKGWIPANSLEII